MPVTLSEMLHDPLAAMVPPVRLMDVVPAVAVSDPLQPFLEFAGVEITSPVGSVSLTATPVRPAVVFGLVILSVSVVLPFNGMLGVAKVFNRTGGATTVRLADEELPVPPSLEVTGPALFVYAPAVVPVTLSEMLHDRFAAMVPPVRLMEVVPAVAVNDPAQVLLELAGVEMTRPVGSVSLTATPVRVIPFGLVIFNVKVVVPLSGIEDTAKLLSRTGGAATVRLALDELPVPPSFEVTVLVVLV